jgi:IS5 family transposase
MTFATWWKVHPSGAIPGGNGQSGALAGLCAVIAPYYPKGENGRPPVGLGRMLRIYFLQQWSNLSDPGAEEALYESVSMCRFVGIDLGREPVPDETTILKFRHLLEKHHLGKKLFQEV